MRRYLLDTGIASDYINRRHGVAERVRAADIRGDRVGVATPVVGELFGNSLNERGPAAIARSILGS